VGPEIKTSPPPHASRKFLTHPTPDCQPALLAGDLATVLAPLQRGLGSREHAAFVERLRAGSAETGPPAPV